MICLLIQCLLFLVTCLPPQQPVIGIYTMDPDGPPFPVPDGYTYFPASYVKNLEMAGAQVIPLFYHYS